MIKIEKVSVVGWEAAIRGMRNPKNSWDKSDSHPGLSGDEWTYDPGYIVGPNDHDLMLRLAKGGSVHAKYRRYIDVFVDITAPLYFWKDFDTYRTVVSDNPFDIEMNSCSTMHKITDKDFDMGDFSTEHLLLGPLNHYIETISLLNFWRTEYHKATDDSRKKQCWWQLIQLLPASYNQRRTLKLNYEVLAAMYQYRKNHKQDEWRQLCKWIEDLPYSDIITVGFRVKEEKQTEFVIAADPSTGEETVMGGTPEENTIKIQIPKDDVSGKFKNVVLKLLSYRSDFPFEAVTISDNSVIDDSGYASFVVSNDLDAKGLQYDIDHGEILVMDSYNPMNDTLYIYLMKQEGK